jgi:hypothetical protein
MKLKNLFVILAAMLVCPAVFSAELFGTVDALSGSASVSDPSGTSSNMSAGQKIYQGQTVTTASDGEVHIVSEDGGIIAVRPDTVFRVDEYKADGDSSDKIFMSLLKGTIRSITGWIGKLNPSGYLLNTPSGTIGIRGTDHETTVIVSPGEDEPGTYDTVTEGSTVLKTSQGETEVTPGKFAFAPRARGRAPFLLARRPHFWALRRLRIEGRLQQRKIFLRSHLNQMRERRIERIRSLHRERNESIAPGHSLAGERRMDTRNRENHGIRPGHAQRTREAIHERRIMRRRAEHPDDRRGKERRLE